MVLGAFYSVVDTNKTAPGVHRALRRIRMEDEKKP
jgi:hypothetical protein